MVFNMERQCHLIIRYYILQYVSTEGSVYPRYPDGYGGYGGYGFGGGSYLGSGGRGGFGGIFSLIIFRKYFLHMIVELFSVCCFPGCMECV